MIESILGLVAVAVSLAAVTSGAVTLFQFMRPDMLQTIFLWLVFNLGVIVGGIAWHLIRRSPPAAIDRKDCDDIRQRILCSLSELDDRASKILDEIDAIQIQAERL